MYGHTSVAEVALPCLSILCDRDLEYEDFASVTVDAAACESKCT